MKFEITRDKHGGRNVTATIDLYDEGISGCCPEYLDIRRNGELVAQVLLNVPSCPRDWELVLQHANRLIPLARILYKEVFRFREKTPRSTQYMNGGIKDAAAGFITFLAGQEVPSESTPAFLEGAEIAKTIIDFIRKAKEAADAIEKQQQ